MHTQKTQKFSIARRRYSEKSDAERERGPGPGNGNGKSESIGDAKEERRNGEES
ncbi:uncharacterized protein J3R85_015005 [Psidium guajava]|nr:uncharacterized protein J3R85_015005 [Psidium guajava]